MAHRVVEAPNPAPSILDGYDVKVSVWGNCAENLLGSAFINMRFNWTPVTTVRVLIRTWVHGRGWYGRANWVTPSLYFAGAAGMWGVALGPPPPRGSLYINHITLAQQHLLLGGWVYDHEYIWKTGSSSGWCRGV